MRPDPTDPTDPTDRTSAADVDAGHDRDASRLDAVRTGCAAVSADADLVRIDDEALVAHAPTLADRDGDPDPEPDRPPAAPDPEPDPWAVTPGTVPPLDEAAEAAVALVLALDTVNFGSGYHPLLHKEPGCSGSVTIATRLRRWVTSSEPAGLTADRLRHLTAADAHDIFGQPRDDGPLDELMAAFATALHDLGALVDDRYDGRFVALVDDAGGSADALVGILSGMAGFADVTPYRGTVVPFFKRAQLAAADLDRTFAGRPPGRFDDLDQLTAFADNLVPHVLRVDGVLHYDRALAEAIDAGELLPAGSEAEVQIRAAGVTAVERLRARLADDGIALRSSELDQRLWRRGGGPRYKAVPRHRTRSRYY